MPSDEVTEALKETAGNVVGAARKLGLSRNKIRRWLERHSLSAEDFKCD